MPQIYRPPTSLERLFDLMYNLFLLLLMLSHFPECRVYVCMCVLCVCVVCVSKYARR